MQTNFHTKYKVECKIGEGSFSEVLKCQERSTGKYVAAKQLKKHFKSINYASEIPELMVLKKISKHPNVLELYDSYFDTASGKATLVFELMDMSLYDLMKTRKRPIPENRAKKYLYQIIKGIDHLHYHGIFHRDVKPENVLVKGEKVKISDMGSIKGFYSKQPYTEYISTRWYRSPECLLTKGFYGPKMDVWAIGCVYYELLTLKPLFPGSDELDQISKINHVLGSPSVKLMNKLKKVKCRNLVPTFPHKKGTGLNSIIPMITEEGREIFKHMIVYDPESRINVRRLLEHKYFNEIRHEEMMSQRLLSTQSMPAGGCRLTTSPMWLSFITSTKKRRIKRRISRKPCSDKKVLKTQSNMAPRVSTVVSSEVSFSNNTVCSDEADANSSNVYAIRPSDNMKRTKQSHNNTSVEQKPIYTVHPDRIPGCEQISKDTFSNVGAKTFRSVERSFKLKDPSSIMKQDTLNRTTSTLSPSLNRAKNIMKCDVDPQSWQVSQIPRGFPEKVDDSQYLSTALNTNNTYLTAQTKQSDASLYSNDRKAPALHFNTYRNQADSIAMRQENHSTKETGVKPFSTDVLLPTTADMRDHISAKTFQTRNLKVSGLIEDEAVNLPLINKEKMSSITSRQQEMRLNQFYTRPEKIIPSHSVAPFRKAMSTFRESNLAGNDRNQAIFGERKKILMKPSKTLSSLNIKNKQSDTSNVRRRERIDVNIGNKALGFHGKQKH